MAFSSSIILPTGTPFHGTYFTRDLNGNGVTDGAGDLVDGSVMTLRFPGAGSNVAASSQAFLGGINGTIESAALNARFDSFMPSGWGMPGEDGSFVRADRLLNGNKVLCNSREDGRYQFGIRFDTGAARRVLFMRYSYFFHNPNNIAAGQLKQARVCGSLVHGQGISDGDIANVLITTFNGGSGRYFSVQNRDVAGTNGGQNTAIYSSAFTSGSFGYWHLDNVWVTIEAEFTCNSAPGVADGKLRVLARREDTGAIFGDVTVENQALWTHGDAFRYQVLQMYMGNGYDTSCSVYIDRDLYFSHSDSATSAKYILLGNASTYTACTRFTVCDFSNWTPLGEGDAEVEFNVNQGAHPSLSGLYGYAMAGINLPINTSGVALPN